MKKGGREEGLRTLANLFVRVGLPRISKVGRLTAEGNEKKGKKQNAAT